MAASASIHLHRLHAGGADAFGIIGGLLVALDHGDRQAVLEFRDGTAKQRRLARARAGDKIQRERAGASEPHPVFARVAVVLGEDVALDADDPVLAQTRHVDTAKPAAGVHQALGLSETAVNVMVVIMIMVVMMAMGMIMMTVCHRVALGHLIPAAADRTHHSTSHFVDTEFIVRSHLHTWFSEIRAKHRIPCTS